ncbi:DUF421 domain-containing protein [filamentous cyanobacterium CCP5]|nr:DUF421 domain-containing protein [filamentous cyanobacterium CCP5]
MFNNLASLAHTFFFGSLAYIFVILALRISGKRTLSKWNAFDFVVTIAYGSILAAMLLAKGTSLLQGILGLSVLLVLQFVLTWLSARSSVVQKLIKTQPTLLLFRGEFCRNALLQERVTEGEIRAAVRAEGIGSLENVEAVVMETDGSFSVIPNIGSRGDSALADVQGYGASAYSIQ